MSRKYHRNNNLLRLTKNEKMAFETIASLIKMLIYIVSGTCKGIYSLSRYIRRIIFNYHALRKIGYDLQQVLDMVYTLSPRQFEIFCAELFRQQGYKVKLTPPSNDFGRDIVLNGNIFVECKHYSKDNYVGREICQKLLGSMQMLNAEKGIIITTGNYHRNAYECARMVDNLQLMDITHIQKMILDLQPEQISKVIMRTMNAA